MSADDFYALVAEMREAQREFFDAKRRTENSVVRAKGLERRVDQAIREHAKGPPPAGLFDDGASGETP